MSYTQQDLANIKAAIASGADQAMIQGEMVKYRSLDDLRRIKAEIEAELAPSKSGGGIGKMVFPTTSRGL
ncbi:MAG: hypothetical protein OIF54_16090 [Cohaesibacter sp.]|nr:hypothetical protein [Cohaesibacter sp.]